MTKLPRRGFLQLVAGAATFPVASRIAGAQVYPMRPVHWIVGITPGGPNDILARLLGQWLSQRLGQPVVIENRPGAGSNIATEMVAKAAADGYTLLSVATADPINATLYDKHNFNLARDIAPIAGIASISNVTLVHPSVPAKTVTEFIAYAKANPGKLNMASAGNGTTSHVAGELFQMMAGVEMIHVPFRGDAPAITSLLNGQVHVYIGPTATTMEHVRAGNLRALAVATAMRMDALPDIPTVGDFLKGYEANTWYGVGAPKNTPEEIIEGLNKEINAALVDPKIHVRLAGLGGTPLPGSPADFGKLIADETVKWAKVVKFANIRPE